MKFEYHITGMHCVSCIEKIKAALSPHVNLINVTLDPPALQIEADKAPNLDELNTYIASAGKYQLHPQTKAVAPTLPDEPAAQGLMTYYPIFLIAAYILGVAIINNIQSSGINWHGFMQQFMAGFFLVFSAFKLLDIKGFAEGYSTYDLLAKQWYTYGYIYPFLELGLGILYLTGWQPTFTLIATIIIMGFSSLGVINSLLKKQQFQCACLGTILKVPLSIVTLVEDLTMVLLAAISLMQSMS